MLTKPLNDHWTNASLYLILIKIYFFNMGQPRPLFRLFLVFSNKQYNFTTNQCEKMSSAGIRNHNISNMSHHPLPLDHYSRPLIKILQVVEILLFKVSDNKYFSQSPTFLGFFTKVSISLIFLVKSFLCNFYGHLETFNWSH